jgi:hypothetical protein
MLVPEPISQHPYQGATHDGVLDAVQDGGVFQFQPP